jgi:GNAT superfamily N-acetyltransferase
MTLTIRDAVPDDLPQVHQMIGELARHHGDVATISLQDLHHQITTARRAQVLVAAEAEGLVGYALVLTKPNLVTGGVSHEVNHLFVTEWRRRAGIGRALIAAAKARSLAEGAEALLIGTHRENLGAQTAYRDMGLQELPAGGPRFAISLS